MRLGAARVGWVQPGVTRRLLALGATEAGDAVAFANADTLARAAAALAEDGLYRWRGEAFDVRETPDGPALGRLDRGALPSLGVLAWGVHVNGLVRRGDGVHVWVARRAPDKLLDPGKLDHFVAGGVATEMTAEETLAKEAGEEAGLPPALALRARRVATLGYAMERREGLRRDVLACYDLDLPEDFQPRAVDGEVEGFELWPVGKVLDRVRRTNDFKFNVNLVLMDLFLRLGLVPEAEAAPLRAALRASP